jgi:tetratricopeptide (TPR) repeat protein
MKNLSSLLYSPEPKKIVENISLRDYLSYTIYNMENSMKIIRKILFSILFISLVQMAFSAENLKIVVLPFDKLNKEKNAELETLTVGISETLSGALSTVDNFVVIDSNRVKRHLLESAEFKQAIGVETGDIENLRELTKDKLNADFIVYGTFNKIGGNIQLSAKFMNITSGEVIKGSNVHGKYPDEIFNLQEKLAKDLTDKISGKSSSQQQNSIEEYSKSTENYTAYQYYIKGRMEQIQYDVKNYPVAIENYNKALKYDPKYALAWAGLAEVNALWGYQIQYAKGNSAPYLKIAIEQGIKAVEFGPNLYQTHRALSMAYLNNSNFDKAQESIDEAYKLNKQDAEIMQIKAQLKNYGYKEMGTDGTESNRYIMECLALNPELIIAKWSLAHSYSTINKNDLALKEYLEILNINPKHAPALHGIALIYYGMQDYELSRDYAIKTVAADSKTTQHHYTLGLAYYQLKNWNEAIASFENAVKLDPKYEDAVYSIANSYWYQSKWDKAYKYYKRVLEINPNNTEAAKWRDDSYSKMKK